jgi:hypothetical protein
MKRRIRLISSIFSLSLAMLFLSFGVYAAATRSVSITGTISFEMKNIAANVVVSKANGLIGDAAVYTEAGTIEYKLGETQEDETIGLGAISFDDTNYKFKYKVSIENKYTANNTITVTFTAPTAVGLTVKYKVGTGTVTATAPTSNTIAAGATLVYEIEFTLNPLSSGAITNASIGSTFALSI